ncbi:MAG: hypothetical protein ABIY48_00585 [Acidimicrobiales bacterium]
MRHPVFVVVWAALLVAAGAALVLLSPGAALAQDPPPTGVPTPHIIPRPNSGHAPTEAGDRGGALQLGLLVVIVVGVGGAVVHLTRETRRARSGTDR